MDILAMSNLLTDVIVSVTDEEIKATGLNKGEWNPKASADPKRVAKLIECKSKVLVPGGSPANTVMSLSRLGKDTGLLGTLAVDEYGINYEKELLKIGVRPYVGIGEGSSGVSYILVTPDGERTMYTMLGVSGEDMIDEHRGRLLYDTKVFHTSAYEIDESDATLESIILAKTRGATVSLDLASPTVIAKKRGDIEKALEYVDILFISDEELCELAVAPPSPDLAFSYSPETIAYKLGNKGSIVKKEDEIREIQIYGADVVNTNGAGDSYAAGFLFGYLNNFNLEECGRWGSYIASRVVSREEPHL